MKKLNGLTAFVVVAVMLGAYGSAQAAPAAVPTLQGVQTASAFRFISWGDGQFEPSALRATATQASTLHPAFTIFNGDLEQDGVTSTEMNGMVTAMGGLYSRTFLIRGNHDDHVAGSSGLWESYFVTANRPLPAGVANYIALSASSKYLTYSFDYGNSRFIGVDVPGDADLLTGAEAAFVDSRLTDAEAKGLTHAFIFFHGPEYCIANHCTCSAANDGSCTPGNIVNLLNKHPIVSATFHGHEHVLGWVHMDHTRVPGLTRSYEEFFTSPAGGVTNNPDIFPARVNYYYPSMDSAQGFGAIDVNGASFTFKLYKDGVSAPVFSKTFTKTSAVVTAAFRSDGAYDGRLLESTETSGVGGWVNASAITVSVGDDAARRQYRSILSFRTAGLPDNAVITSARLTLRRQTIAPPGSNPFSIFQGLYLDVRNGYFGTAASLQAADFQAAANGSLGPFSPAPIGTLYSINLGSAAFPYINKLATNAGLTQLRARFKLDDNNNAVANFISFYSGDYATVGERPLLIIQYHMP